MKRLFTVPAIGLILAFLLAHEVTKAQVYFTSEVKGKGKPMILIHGLYCNGEVWKETMERYQQQYECHVLTLAGFGGHAPNLNDHFLESVKDDIIQYAKDKKLNKPVIAGHSMGGFISLWAASSAPGLFEKVLAVDGVPFMTALQMPNATPESAKPMAENMRSMMSTLTPEQIKMNQKMYLPTMIQSQDRIEQISFIAQKCDSKTIGQVMYEMFTIDLRQTVASIDCPVLLLGAWVAYKDYGVTKESATNSYTAQLKTVKNAKVEMSDTARHFIFYDDPAWFYQKVDGFLGNL
ncbi:MAG: alpha/beta hydrolase [Flammeovirgaceae bacterium]|nr:alpha/beta hydrolase [Flammeovirgaceae bacterium]